jgi:sugar lactone lactonase YvrE
MRKIGGGLIALALLSANAGIAADPAAAPEYALEVVRKPGAIFAGLARDGDALLVTNLADGRLYRRSSDGAFSAFGPLLPHGLDVIGDPTGPYRVARHGSSYIVAQGWTPAGAAEGPYDHALLAIDEAAVRVLSGDFWNPYDFVATADGFYVIDAARNTVERLSADGRVRETLFTFARLTASGAALQTLSPTEFADQQSHEFDAVPTGIAAHGGRLHVSLFGGFPFLASSGRIVSLPEAGAATTARIEAADLNAPVDVVFDDEGGMLVLEHGLFEPSGIWVAGSGRLLAIAPSTGARRVLLDDLTRPVSVLVWDERTLIVSDLGGNLSILTRRSVE